MQRVIWVFVALLSLAYAATAAWAAAPCCSITALNSRDGVATAKVNASGATFQFEFKATRLAPLRVGQAVYANFKAKQVSLDGKSACCKIIAGPTATTTATPSSSAPSNCQSGYYGPNCAPCGCSPQGTVSCNDGLYGNGACVCISGFNGNKCQYSNAIQCNNHGVVDATGQCACSAGYSGATCNVKN